MLLTEWVSAVKVVEDEFAEKLLQVILKENDPEVQKQIARRTFWLRDGRRTA